MPERPGDMDERDVDARFASIIAQWEGPVPTGDDTAPGSTASDAGGARPAAASPAADGSTTDTGTTTDGTATDAGDDVTDAGEPAPPASPRSPWVNPSPLDLVVPASAWRAAEPTGAQAAADADGDDGPAEESHFEPPEVELPPQEDLHFWGAVIGLVAGPLMLLYVVFARPFHSTRWFVASVVISLLGFALLVLRQPTHRDPTSGDDGARV